MDSRPDGPEEVDYKNGNQGISRSKVITYLLLTVVFVVSSYFSLVFIYHFFSDKSSFLSLSFITAQVSIQLAILLVFYFLLDMLRFLYILKTIGFSVKFGFMIKISFINMFISSITPFAAGGGFAQVYFLNKIGVPLGDATAASTIRTILPIIFFFITTPFVLIFNPKLMGSILGDQSFIYIGLLIIVYGVITYICYRLIRNINLTKAFIYRLFKFLTSKRIISRKRSRRITKRLFDEMERFANSFKMFLHGNWMDITLSIVFMILYLLALFTFPIILIHALGYNISAFSIISLQMVITLITYFAFTPGATGIAEGGFSLLFSSLISDKDIVSLTFTWRFFSTYIGVIIGLVIFYVEVFKGFSIRRIKKKGL
jgi:uncharacterized protein (TIRG00374 family)